jgi:hypothetical protein
MKRREFITLLGGAAAKWPLAARAQQPTMPVVGFLSGGLPGALAHLVAAFTQGLEETGLADQSVSIEYRWANGDYDRLPGLAGELVRLRGRQSSQAARRRQRPPLRRCRSSSSSLSIRSRADWLPA